MYKLGDKIFLKEEYDRVLNNTGYRGKEVEIIAISRYGEFLQYYVKSMEGRAHWISKKGIKSIKDLLGIKV